MDVYRVIAERIIEKLEQGTVPWHKSWQSMGAPNSCLPRRLCGASARCRVGTPRGGPKLAATPLRGCGLVLRAHFAVRKEFDLQKHEVYKQKDVWPGPGLMGCCRVKRITSSSF